MCNALILRVFRRMRVFLLCAFERQKNALVSAEKSSSKKKTKNFSLLFFPPFPNALSSKKLVHISIEMKKEEMKNKRERTTTTTTTRTSEVAREFYRSTNSRIFSSRGCATSTSSDVCDEIFGYHRRPNAAWMKDEDDEKKRRRRRRQMF